MMIKKIPQVPTNSDPDICEPTPKFKFWLPIFCFLSQVWGFQKGMSHPCRTKIQGGDRFSRNSCFGPGPGLHLRPADHPIKSYSTFYSIWQTNTQMHPLPNMDRWNFWYNFFLPFLITSTSLCLWRISTIILVWSVSKTYLS